MKSPALIPRVIRFGVFEFSPQTSELRKHGLKIKLEPQPSKILLLLLEHPGKICARQEFQQQLWQDNTLVDFERSLYKGIHTLRGTLGDSAIAPRYIETVTGRGYILSAFVRFSDTRIVSHRSCSLAKLPDLIGLTAHAIRFRGSGLRFPLSGLACAQVVKELS